MQKNNVLKTKRILKPKYKPSGALFYIYLARNATRPSASRQLRYCFLVTFTYCGCGRHLLNGADRLVAETLILGNQA